MGDLVAINGQVFKPQDAKISVFDRGFLFGDGIYEVTRSYGRVLFALEEHIDRLYRSAGRIDLDIGYTKEALIQELYRIYQLADMDDAYMRIVITRGEGRINIDPTMGGKPNMVVFIKPVDKIDPAVYENGVDLITAKVMRNPKWALDPNIKSGNYLNNIMALGEARKEKAYDAVMVNSLGYITEGTTWNIFLVKDQKYVTAPDEADILQGITRKILKKICAANGLQWEERFFTPAELKAADESFTTGSVKEVVPVKSVDGSVIGSGKPGPMTQKLAKLYKEYVQNYCRERRR